MTIQEAQKTVDLWINTIGVRYYNELTNTSLEIITNTLLDHPQAGLQGLRDLVHQVQHGHQAERARSRKPGLTIYFLHRFCTFQNTFVSIGGQDIRVGPRRGRPRGHKVLRPLASKVQLGHQADKVRLFFCVS